MAFKNILVPTDFEAASRKALDLATMLGEKFESSITLFHAFQLPATPYLAPVPWPIGDFEAAARALLDRELAAVKARFPRVNAVLEMGYPSVLILEHLKAHEFDLVVMGTHGRHGVARIMGSVAARVVRLAEIPVLTVSAHAAAG